MENNIAVVHYYCRPHMRTFCDNVCHDLGIELQSITDIHNIVEVSQNARSFTHVDALIFDLGSFDNEPIEIRDAVYAIVTIRGDIPIIILDFAHDSSDEQVQLYRSYGFEMIYTRDLSESALYNFLGGENGAQVYENRNSDIKQYDENTANVFVEKDVLQEAEQEEHEKVLQFEEKSEAAEPKYQVNDTEHAEAVQQEKKIEAEKSTDITINKPVEQATDKPNILDTQSDIVQTHEADKENAYRKSESKKDEKTKKAFGFFKSEKASTAFPSSGKQIIMIAVGGTEQHIGTTHHAIALVKYLNSIGQKACYINANKRNIVADTKKYIVSDAYPEKIICCKVPMYYPNISLMQIIAQKYRYYIFDYGTLSEVSELDFYNKDIRVIVAGTKPWEIDKLTAICEQTQLYGIDVIANFADESLRESLRSAYQSNKLHFAEYSPNPFVNRDNEAIYREIIANN